MSHRLLPLLLLACSAPASEQPPVVVAVHDAPDAAPVATRPPTPAERAEPTPPPVRHDAAFAEAAFRRGKEAMARGDYEVARREFERSLEADEAVGTLLNLALAEEKLGDTSGAIRDYRRALALKPNGDRAAFVKDRLRALGVP